MMVLLLICVVTLLAFSASGQDMFGRISMQSTKTLLISREKMSLDWQGWAGVGDLLCRACFRYIGSGIKAACELALRFVKRLCFIPQKFGDGQTACQGQRGW